MKISIEKKEDGKWYLNLDSDKADTHYGSLYKLTRALLKYAKGQNL